MAEGTTENRYPFATTVLLAAVVPVALDAVARFAVQFMPASSNDFVMLIPAALGGGTAASSPFDRDPELGLVAF